MATALLCYLEEFEAYFCLEKIINEIMPPDFYSEVHSDIQLTPSEHDRIQSRRKSIWRYL